MLDFAQAPSQNNSENQQMVSISEVKSIIDRRCISCHSDNPTDDVFTVAPSGFMLNTEEHIIASKNLIYQRTVATNSMPFNNKTNMTESEREKLKIWFERE